MTLRWTSERLAIRLSQGEWKILEGQGTVKVAFPLPFNLQHQVSLCLSKSPQIVWNETGIEAQLPADLSFQSRAKNQAVYRFQLNPQFLVDIEVDFFSESQRARRKET
jgi:hypothetical protein